VSGLLSVLGVIGKLGILLIILILLAVLSYLILNKSFPWFRNFNVNAFKPSERRKRSSEEAYLAALECGEIVAPKVTLTGISLVTRTKGVIRLFQMTESGLKELKQVNYCFECEGMYSAWWEAISLSDSPFKGSEKYRFVGVLTNGKRMQFCLHERYLDSGKSYMISSSEGLGADRIDLKLTNLTPNATYLLGQLTYTADENGCIADYYYRKDSYAWLRETSYHLSRVDSYDFTDIMDIKLSLWNPYK
jgi:hypothetical protein